MYSQLTQAERYQIQAYKQSGLSQKAIGEKLNRHSSTISRELCRNTGQRGYRPQQAHNKAATRRTTARKAIKLDAKMQKRLVQHLQKDWSPEQITGYCQRNKLGMVSHERIYLFIWADMAAGGELHMHLRHQRKLYKKRYGKQDGRGCIPDRVSIDERPAIVETKSRIGDWEGDTIIGKGHKGAVVTLVDRNSKFTLMKQVDNKTEENVTAAILALLKPYQSLVHTITFDNGKEFSNHKKIAKELNTDVYFAHPYHSWERGLNENTNGLIRQYLPKAEVLRNICPKKIIDISDKLNNRPRKTLDFKTPLEIFSRVA
jgi:IS30 family transposase